MNLLNILVLVVLQFSYLFFGILSVLFQLMTAVGLVTPCPENVTVVSFRVGPSSDEDQAGAAGEGVAGAVLVGGGGGPVDAELVGQLFASLNAQAQGDETSGPPTELVGQLFAALNAQAQGEELSGPPTEAETIKQLPTTTIDAAMLAEGEGRGCDKTCAICMSDYAVGDLVKTLPCQHRHHAGCIDPWLGRSQKCPMCMVSVHGADAPDQYNDAQKRREIRRQMSRQAEFQQMGIRMF